MKKLFKLGVIGCGFMAKSIITGILNKGVLKAKQIIVTDVNFDNMEKMKKYGVSTTIDNKYLIENSKYVLFAVKPQNIKDLLKELKDTSLERAISIMAGVKKEKFKDVFPEIKIARCMPNMPCSVGFGETAIDMEDFNEKECEFASSVFKSIGSVLVCNESKMDAVTSISGSGPAYVYLFIDSLIKAGVSQGLDENEAKELTLNTVIGAAKLLAKNNEKSIDELINAVCSKGGTTIEAMNVFEKNNFRGIIEEAVTACKNRAEELSNT